MSRIVPYVLIGTRTAALASFGVAWWRSKVTTNAIEKAVGAAPSYTGGTGGTMKIHATGYWPFTARADERQMEGGLFDRMMPAKYKNDPNSAEYKAHLLRTVEDYVAGKSDFVSLSGDDAIFPYGQKLIINGWPGIPNMIGRVVDTGSHFRGVKKVYRVIGEEPIDFCVASSKTVVPKKGITASIVPGDHWKSKLTEVATSKLKDQTVVTGMLRGDADYAWWGGRCYEIAGEPAPVVEARTSADREALARAIESNLAGRTREEQVAGGWALRNCADSSGVSVHHLLAPSGEYGPATKTGGLASTRRTPTASSLAVADEVLGASAGEDPIQGATDWWLPAEQERMHQLGDIYRAAVRSGDKVKAAKYARYAKFGDEGAVRVQHARDGLRVVRVIGAVELLGRAG